MTSEERIAAAGRTISAALADIAGAVHELETRPPKTMPSNKKKLTASEVDQIRRIRRTTGATHRELGEMFAVNRATVTRILNGQYWK